jgi:hypothetical protein
LRGQGNLTGIHDVKLLAHFSFDVYGYATIAPATIAPTLPRSTAVIIVVVVGSRGIVAVAVPLSPTTTTTTTTNPCPELLTLHRVDETRSKVRGQAAQEVVPLEHRT